MEFKNSTSYVQTSPNEHYRIAMVSAEVKPYCKKGGIADVITDLSKQFVNDGHEVDVITFMSSELQKGLNSESDLKCINKGKYNVSLNGTEVTFTCSEYNIAENLNLYVLEDDNFLTPLTSVYPSSGTQNIDDYFKKYAVFSLAAAELILRQPDQDRIVDFHDYHAALVAPILKSKDFNGGIVQTIHGLGYGDGSGFQGCCDRSITDLVGLSDYFRVGQHESIEFGSYVDENNKLVERVNFMKGGLVFSDKVVAVSEKYAEEIVSAPFGGGLEGVLATIKKEQKLVGITNGIDTTYPYFRPETEDSVIVPFTSNDDIIAKKIQNRIRLNYLLNNNKAIESREKDKLKGTPVLSRGFTDPTKLTIGMVARLADQKFKILLEDDGKYLEQILDTGVNVLVCASGDPSSTLYKTLMHIAEKPQYKGNFVWMDNSVQFNYRPIDFNKPFSKSKNSKKMVFDEKGHIVYAACDFFLNPALYEPCGLTQMIAMMMGAVPVVTETGGLSSTVNDVDKKCQTGVFIEQREGKSVPRAIQRIVNIPLNERREIIKNAMLVDNAWVHVVPNYYSAFREISRSRSNHFSDSQQNTSVTLDSQALSSN